MARNLVPADRIEAAGVQQYGQLLEQARAKNALAGDSNPQLQRLRAIAKRLIPFATPWNPRARDWKWEVNLIGSKQINAFCMPGGKIAFFTGILEQLKLTDDEVAMVMGHEMAHALREHARARMAKSAGTGAALSIGAQLLGWGQVGDLAARAGTQLLTLKFSRSDETEADLVGLELAARAGYDPKASVSLWKKMAAASKNQGSLNFLRRTRVGRIASRSSKRTCRRSSSSTATRRRADLHDALSPLGRGRRSLDKSRASSSAPVLSPRERGANPDTFQIRATPRFPLARRLHLNLYTCLDA